MAVTAKFTGKPLQVNIDEKSKGRIIRLADRLGVSQASIVRRLIRKSLRQLEEEVEREIEEEKQL